MVRWKIYYIWKKLIISICIKIDNKGINTKVHYLKTDRIVENNRGLPGTCKHWNIVNYYCKFDKMFIHIKLRNSLSAKIHFNQYSYKLKTPARFYKINVKHLSWITRFSVILHSILSEGQGEKAIIPPQRFFFVTWEYMDKHIILRVRNISIIKCPPETNFFLCLLSLILSKCL